MPIVHMCGDYHKAHELGTNVKLYHSLSRTIKPCQVNQFMVDTYGDTRPIGTWVGTNACLGADADEYEIEYFGWTYETHHGLCIQEREHNGYDDSDFYMLVWNPETNLPESICFASTRGWSYPCYASHVDATPEIQAKYDAYRKELAVKYEQERQAAIARTPAKGKTLKVVHGRKIPHGTVGLCFWAGKTQFGTRVGLKTESGETLWTAIDNVEVVL